MENVVYRLPSMLLSPADLWLICGAVALCFLALGGIHQTTVASGTQKCSQRQVNYRIAAAAIATVIALTGMGLLPVILIALVAAVCAMQVVLDLYGIN
jgi:hypothetical protein